ncbi:murein hydrolase activator EnvC family protein [Tepidamorphus sp. 3E244]|uniref:murein hydrolase activator EnvC family protein n=1 Tax=Tepidamorphus sp. 3E244 TaxID=3385498 RepID=UPI0038FC4D4F
MNAAIFRVATVALGACLVAPAAYGAGDDPEKTRKELDAVNADLESQRRKLLEIEAEVDGLKNDRAQINAKLIATAERIKQYETAILRSEQRLEQHAIREGELREELSGQRKVFAVLLGALQKLGHRPPPAVVVSPDNALATVRSAMLLGAVVPDLRRETDKLGRDLAELVSVKKQIADERIRLSEETEKLGDDQLRLTALLDAKTKDSIAAEERMSSEQKRAEDLAARAEDLQTLLATIEKESERRAAELAAAPKEPEKPVEQAIRDTGRLRPAVKFASAQGMLALPAAGAVIREFGAPDPYGSKSGGISIATRAKAQVTAPSDGWIAYSGPFRSYGQLLIIDAGDGYHIVMAGLNSVNAEVGQFVLAGEPVGQMGTLALASAVAPTGGPIQPVLYVEFRKDGRAINPQPWWADKSDGANG